MRGYYMFPDIYGDDIIFVTEDDLWKFSRGVGVRLTSDFGVVVRPKFSPDSRWIAFTRLQQTDQGTAADVYVIPAEGGEPRRITYFGTPYTRVVGWTPDGGSSYTATSRRPVARALRGLPHRGLREAEPRSRHGVDIRRWGGDLRPQHLRSPPLEAV